MELEGIALCFKKESLAGKAEPFRTSSGRAVKREVQYDKT